MLFSGLLCYFQDCFSFYQEPLGPAAEAATNTKQDEPNDDKKALKSQANKDNNAFLYAMSHEDQKHVIERWEQIKNMKTGVNKFKAEFRSEWLKTRSFQTGFFEELRSMYEKESETTRIHCLKL